MDFTLIREVLSSGSDLATIGLLVVMWRFDRRLLVLETTTLLKGINHV